jgi:hypothetical protein
MSTRLTAVHIVVRSCAWFPIILVNSPVRAEPPAATQERMFEWTIESHKVYADPFNDVEVDVIFTKDRQSWRVPTFWRGGQRWTVRFPLPTPSPKGEGNTNEPPPRDQICSFIIQQSGSPSRGDIVGWNRAPIDAEEFNKAARSIDTALENGITRASTSWTFFSCMSPIR